MTEQLASNVATPYVPKPFTPNRPALEAIIARQQLKALHAPPEVVQQHERVIRVIGQIIAEVFS